MMLFIRGTSSVDEMQCCLEYFIIKRVNRWKPHGIVARHILAIYTFIYLHIYEDHISTARHVSGKKPC